MRDDPPVGWFQWRGPQRDGICQRLPASLPDTAECLWQFDLPSEGIGGIAATDRFVVVGSRDAADTQDVFTCHRFETGEEVWRISYPAIGELDYGNSPRATPLLVGDRVVMLGAFGHLTVAKLATGEILWQISFADAFGATVPTWGFCGSPLQIDAVVAGQKRSTVVVQPGSAEASLVALDIESGEIIWQAAGNRPGYSSFILAAVQGQEQLIGYDETSLGGWDLAGNRLWELVPESSGDFNVPTPIVTGNRLFVATENNGLRLFEFDSNGKVSGQPVAKFDDLRPDTHTPVLVGKYLLGVHYGLHCLNGSDLKLVARMEDDVFSEYVSAISDGGQRVLFTSINGELVLVEIAGDRCQIKSRLRLSDTEEIMSHPAIVGNRFIVRVGKRLCCLNWN